jgi:hypothetical protein
MLLPYLLVHSNVSIVTAGFHIVIVPLLIIPGTA